MRLIALFCLCIYTSASTWVYAEDIELPPILFGNERIQIMAEGLADIGNNMIDELRENRSGITRTHLSDVFDGFHKRFNKHLASTSAGSEWCPRTSDPENCSIFQETLDEYVAVLAADIQSNTRKLHESVTTGLAAHLDENLKYITTDFVNQGIFDHFREQLNITLTQMEQQKTAYEEFSHQDAYADGDPHNSLFDIMSGMESVEDMFIGYSPFLDEENELYDEEFAQTLEIYKGISFGGEEGPRAGIGGLFSFERGGYPGGGKHYVFDLASGITEMLRQSDNFVCAKIACGSDGAKYEVVENVKRDSLETNRGVVQEMDHTTGEAEVDYLQNEAHIPSHNEVDEHGTEYRVQGTDHTGDSEQSRQVGMNERSAQYVEDVLIDTYGEPSNDSCGGGVQVEAEFMCIDIDVRKSRHNMSLHITSGSRYKLREGGYSDDILGIFQRGVDILSQIAKSDLGCRQRPTINHFQMSRSNKWSLELSGLNLYIKLKTPPFLRQYASERLLKHFDLLKMEEVIAESGTEGAGGEILTAEYEVQDWSLNQSQIDFLDSMYKEFSLDFVPANLGNSLGMTESTYFHALLPRGDAPIDANLRNDHHFYDEVKKRHLHETYHIRPDKPESSSSFRFKEFRQNARLISEIIGEMITPLKTIESKRHCVSF